MSQDNRDKEEKRNSQMMKISFVSLAAVLLFIIEMYEIINDPTNFIAIGALGVFILAAVYADVFFIGKMNEKRAKDQEEAFDNVYRSEKASYLLMRKYFDQMEQKMDTFGDKAALPYKELVSAQKALAKVQINRSKQNANALLISNDKMLQKISSFQKEIADSAVNTNGIGLTEEDKAELTEGNKDILAKQQEILTGLKELESSLRNEILESANKLASMKSQQMVTPEPQMPVMENSELQSLDLDHEFSFDSDLASNQILENSTESDLDKLLMGMDEEDSSEPELAPIMDEAQLEPFAEPELGALDTLSLEEEPELGALDAFSSKEESKSGPIMAEPEPGSLDGIQPELESMTAEPELGALDEINVNDTNEEPELKPMEAEPELELGSFDGLDLESEIESMTAEPESGAPDTVNLNEEPELEPMMAEPELELGSLDDLNIESEINTMAAAEPELGSLDDLNIESEINTMAAAEPELGALDTIDTSDLDSVMEKPESSAVDKSASEQLNHVHKESELEPIMPESELDAMLQQAMAAESEHQAIKAEAAALEHQAVKTEPAPAAAEPIKETKPTDSMAANKRPLPDLSDPNHEVTPDELAAMVANLGSIDELELDPIFSEQTESKPEETVSDSVKQESEAVKEAEQLPEVSISKETEKSSEIEDSDLDQIMKAMDIDDILEEPVEDLDIDKILEVPLANKKSDESISDQFMSSDEIAALIANTNLLSEPEQTKNSDLPDLSDPGYVMSSDEIAALIANM